LIRPRFRWRYPDPFVGHDAYEGIAALKKDDAAAEQVLKGHSLPAFKGAFPNFALPPACPCKVIPYFQITANIGGDLISPELRARCWPPEEMAIVSMPEAAMDHYDRSSSRKHHVRLSRQVLHMKPITPAKCMQTAPNKHFRSGVFRSDASHHPAADGGCDPVNQQP
jgi:hypothetical protein